MKLTRIVFGEGRMVAEGDPGDDADRQRLSAAFEREVNAGRYAIVPTGLDGCCRRGLMVTRFEDVPSEAPLVQFLRRES